MPFEPSKNNPIGRTEKEPYGIQHDPLDYSRPSYLDPARMSSYGYQYKLAYESGGKSFINVGSSNHLLSDLLREQGRFVLDLDLDFRTKPDVLGLIPKLPFKPKVFDVALCFQMLEHLRFSSFSDNLIELSRVADTIIISLPDITLTKREVFKYKFYKKLHFPKEWIIYKPRKIDEEHFWEIGDGKIFYDDVLRELEIANLSLIKHFRNSLNRYHHFFVLKVN